jgi:plastocyanin
VHRRLSLTAIVLVGLAFVGCGGTPATQAPSPQAPTGTEAPAADGASVSIVDNAFDPTSVSVGVGDTVTWTNDGQNAHTVTFADGVDSDSIAAGATFDHTFDEAGEFSYVCKFHGNMQATVTVE